MNFAGVDLNLFVVFDAIYAERSLTRASELLNITQPAVSNALARLRVAFDDPLFVRVGRTMTPSPLAQNLIGPVRAALRQLRSSIDQGRKFEPALSEKIFSVSLRDSADTQLIPALLGNLAISAPGVRIHSAPVDRREIVGELASGQLDLAIDVPELARSELRSTALRADRHVCVMRRGHPLATDSLTLEKFLAAPQILVSSRRNGRGYVEIALGRQGLQMDVFLRLTHFQPAFHVVAETDMLLTAPLSLARKYDVVTRDLPFTVPPLETVLYWHRNADQDPANIWIRNEFIRASRMQPAQDAQGADHLTRAVPEKFGTAR